MADLKSLECVPCKGTEPKLGDQAIAAYRQQVPDWQVAEQDGEKRLVRTFKLKNFSEALDFTNQIGRIAEEQDHHPMITTEWGKVTVAWWTHKIGGLHQNDFIMAARTDELYRAF